MLGPIFKEFARERSLETATPLVVASRTICDVIFFFFFLCSTVNFSSWLRVFFFSGWCFSSLLSYCFLFKLNFTICFCFIFYLVWYIFFPFRYFFFSFNSTFYSWLTFNSVSATVFSLFLDHFLFFMFTCKRHFLCLYYFSPRESHVLFSNFQHTHTHAFRNIQKSVRGYLLICPVSKLFAYTLTFENI